MATDHNSGLSASEREFWQEGPSLKNAFESDDLLRQFLRWRLPAEMLAEIEPGLIQFGERVVTDVQRWGEEAEAQPPRHVPFDPWGRRIDKIEVAEAWQKLDRVSAEEGLIAIGYERAHGAHSRLHQFAKLYLFHPSSAFYSCPLAMTDGAARVIELHGSSEMKAEAFKNLTSRNPQRFWTSGQWMTERTGGSDVSGTSTIARREGEGHCLYGDKWFTSATTAQMAMALSRVEGTEGLSLFYVELRDRAGSLRNIRINRLKDKLGTKALPTAELTLFGTPGRMVGGEGEGVKRIAALLNITRLYNATCSVSTMARLMQLAKDYARKRRTFGKTLAEHPLHLRTLADLQVDFEAMFHLCFHLIGLLGRDEVDVGEEGGKGNIGTGVRVGANDRDHRTSVLLRLLTPIAKLMTAKAAIAVTSEVIESFGGAGYVEDTGLPRFLRDAQVFSIWEGTTNVLSLDVLRAISKENALEPFFIDVESRLASIASDALRTEVETVRAATQTIKSYVKLWAGLETTERNLVVQAGARGFAFSLGRVFTASLLLEFADWCEGRKQRPGSTEIARRFCRRPLATLSPLEELEFDRLERLIFG